MSVAPDASPLTQLNDPILGTNVGGTPTLHNEDFQITAPATPAEIPRFNAPEQLLQETCADIVTPARNIAVSAGAARIAPAMTPKLIFALALVQTSLPVRRFAMSAVPRPNHGAILMIAPIGG